MAKVINGPHLPVPANSRYTLDELRDVRWGLLTKQEQGMRLMEARAVLAAAPVTDTPEVVRLREAANALLTAMTTRALRGRDHVPSMRDEQNAKAALAAALAKHPTSPEDAA